MTEEHTPYRVSPIVRCPRCKHPIQLMDERARAVEERARALLAVLDTEAWVRPLGFDAAAARLREALP